MKSSSGNDVTSFVFWKDPTNEKIKEVLGYGTDGYCSKIQKMEMGWSRRVAMRMEREPAEGWSSTQRGTDSYYCMSSSGSEY